MAQAQEVKTRLIAVNPALAKQNSIEIKVIATTGDRIQDKPLSEVGGKGLFTKEIEQALLEGQIDIAVHSMKDVATQLPSGLVIPSVLPREDVRDVWISKTGQRLQELPAGSIVGTASLRRQALVLNKRPDLQVKTFRGTVGTRLEKLAQGQADATLLALAGLNRLKKQDCISHIFTSDEFLPAVAQGAIGLEVRQDDQRVLALVAGLNDPVTFAQITAERACLYVLDGSCRTPIAAYAAYDSSQQRLRLKAFAGTPDGKEGYWAEKSAEMSAAQQLGESVGHDIRAQAGQDFFERLKQYEGTWRGALS